MDNSVDIFLSFVYNIYISKLTKKVMTPDAKWIIGGIVLGVIGLGYFVIHMISYYLYLN